MYTLTEFLWLAAAGVSGAFIGMLSSTSHRTLYQRFIFIVSGLLVSFWITPFLCKQFNFNTQEDISVMAFSAGAFWSGIVKNIGQVISKSNINKDKK